MIDGKVINELDRNVNYFIWYMNHCMNHILATELSCDGHGKNAAYVIVRPVSDRLFEEFRKSVSALDGVELETTFIRERQKYKLLIMYESTYDLFHRQHAIMRIGDSLS